ncbi:MAG TPA: acyl-CoA thioesterase [Gemmatimonadales bacterium]|nr:acyl-CoA thioesterase [Gemmatimonadales bacterium]
MTDIFTRRFVVPAEAIDAQRHVNNLAYLQWMQDVAIEHSAAVGWTMERYVAAGSGWVARSHFIEYLRPGFEGEALALHTWISEAGGRRAVRHYVVVREADRMVLARAETHWVYVDLATGRPAPIPEDLANAFPVVEKEAAMGRLGLVR